MNQRYAPERQGTGDGRTARLARFDDGAARRRPPSRSTALHAQLAQLIEFHPQSVTQGPLGAALLEQRFTSGERLFADFAPFEQRTPGPRNFSFG